MTFHESLLNTQAQQPVPPREQESGSKRTSVRSCLCLTPIHGKKLVLAQDTVAKSLNCPCLGTVL